MNIDDFKREDLDKLRNSDGKFDSVSKGAIERLTGVTFKAAIEKLDNDDDQPSDAGGDNSITINWNGEEEAITSKSQLKNAEKKGHFFAEARKTGANPTEAYDALPD